MTWSEITSAPRPFVDAAAMVLDPAAARRLGRSETTVLVFGGSRKAGSKGLNSAYLYFPDQ